MKTLIIVQARLGSKRLPKKISLPALGCSLLEHTLSRLATLNIPIVLASPEGDERDFYYTLKKRCNIDLFFGSEKSVLERYYLAAKKYHGDIIVRVTGDCPLVQPTLLKEMIAFYQKHFNDYDYISNVIERSYPKGMDLELFSFSALEKVYQSNPGLYTKEHVTPLFYDKSAGFRTHNFSHHRDLSHFNVSVDTKEDYSSVRKLIEKYAPNNPYFELQEMEEFAS